jgi:hypothetical protein
MATKSQQVRSLQELSAARLQDVILNSDTADDDFASLEPRIQMLLFNSLRTEHARLRGVSEDFERLSRRIPRVDLQLYSTMSTNVSGELASDIDRDLHRSTWHYLKSLEDYDGDRHPRRHKDFRQWDFQEYKNYQLHAELPGTEFKIPLQGRWSPTWSKLPLGLSSNRISSQLLLYRINAIFGMPPPAGKEEFNYWSPWGLKLLHMDGVSVITCTDHMGAASIDFSGIKKASDDALDLLNYLVGPHFKCMLSGSSTDS